MHSTWSSQLSQTVSRNSPWWLLLLEGIAAIIIGVFLLISPGMTTLVLVQFLGFYWLFCGVLSLVSLFVDRSNWGWKLCAGILGIIAGLIVIRHPLWSAVLVPTTLVWLLGILGIVEGIAKFVQAFRGGGGGMAVLGILSILFGIFLLFAPVIAALALILVLGIFAIVGGIGAIILAFRVRNAPLPSTEPAPNF